MFYNQKVLELFKNPINAGGLQGANGVSKVGEQASGDVIKFYFKIDENEVITEARFKAFGGAAAIASASVATELVINKTINEAMNIYANDIELALEELPAQKKYCAKLAEDGINATVADYLKRKAKEEKLKTISK